MNRIPIKSANSFSCIQVDWYGRLAMMLQDDLTIQAVKAHLLTFLRLKWWTRSLAACYVGQHCSDSGRIGTRTWYHFYVELPMLQPKLEIEVLRP